ncbi:MAG: DoxX family protein [Pseudomonadota bacterium]
MLAETQLPNHRALLLAARFLFTSLFLLSGVTHFTNIPYYVSLMPEAVPFPVPLIFISGVVELVGAVMVLFNWYPRFGAWLLIIFLIPVTFVVHGYELMTETDPALWALQQAHFLKGFALMGAALLITQLGVGHYFPRAKAEPATTTHPAA